MHVTMPLLPFHHLHIPCRPRPFTPQPNSPPASLLSSKGLLPASCRARGPEDPIFPKNDLRPSRIGGTIESKNSVTAKGIRCTAGPSPSKEGRCGTVKDKSVSVILLAGGKGKRMGASMPKQYLPLLGQPIALYSFHTFSHMNEVKEVIVVCDPSYIDVFQDAVESHVDLKFALPGKERQDSVFSGLQEIDGSSELVCIHDSARPLVLTEDVRKVLADGLLNGAAVLGVPVKATIKEANSNSFVVKTLDRKTLWEMQTPQVIKPDLLRKGFELVHREDLEVTDDVSIVEHLKECVYITEGSYTNIKVTTPDDLLLAERILNLEKSVVCDWWYSAPFTLKKVIASRSSKFFPRGMQRGGPEDFWQCLRPDLGGKFGSTSLSWLTSSVVEFHQYP